jgi:hypothetical protein
LETWERFAVAERKAYKGKLRGQDCSYLAAHYDNRVKPTFKADSETVMAPGTYIKKICLSGKTLTFCGLKRPYGVKTSGKHGLEFGGDD